MNGSAQHIIKTELQDVGIDRNAIAESSVSKYDISESSKMLLSGTEGIESNTHWWESFRQSAYTLFLDKNDDLHFDNCKFGRQPKAMHLNDASDSEDARVTALQQYLYTKFYIRPRKVEIPKSLWQPDIYSMRQSGPWKVLERFKGGALAARCGTVVKRLEAGEYIFDGIPATPSRNNYVQRIRHSWSGSLDPHFYYFFGQTEADTFAEDAQVRYYFAVKPECLGALIPWLIRLLDKHLLPFQLKFPQHALDITRSDTVVLYVGARFAIHTHNLLAKHCQQLANYLTPDAPLWAKMLQPGLSFAQDPANGNSFGENRCLALADGLLRATRKNDKNILYHVKSAFSDAGIDWQHPYLQANIDVYHLKQLHFDSTTKHMGDRKSKKSPRSLPPANEKLLQAACAIGHQLCSESIWHNNMCNWMTDDVDDKHGQLKVFTRPMNANLYDGTVGVAAFLSLLSEVCSEERFSFVARGALRLALHRIDNNPQDNSLGLYEGKLGTLTQGIQLALNLNDNELLEHYCYLTELAITDITKNPLDVQANETDLMHGYAGAILGLLGLVKSSLAFTQPKLIARATTLATQMGRRLTQLAQRSSAGWHWPGEHHRLGLCGLSHGNAGIALAFASLMQIDAGPQWANALQSTLDYEDHWYIAGQNNWPYLFTEDATKLTDSPKKCGMAWCHGAPGIALSRLQLWQLTGKDTLRQEAYKALIKVAQDLVSPASRAGKSFTLCHGPAGNADVLLTGAHMLNKPSWQAIAHDVALKSLIKREEQGFWQSGLGVNGGNSFGLMLGLAGTGYFLLRCASPQPLPSLLLPIGAI